jgi:hypothetical protein
VTRRLPRLFFAANGEGANANSGFFEDGYATPPQGRLQNWKVGQQHRSLTLGPSGVLCSEEHNRRLTLLSQRQEHAEIGIRRDECAAFIPGALENLGVYGGLQTAIAHMDRVIPTSSQLLREDRR